VGEKTNSPVRLTRVPQWGKKNFPHFFVLVFEGKKRMLAKIWCTDFHPSSLYNGTTKLEAL
jgi:hypothetical protein